MEQYLTTIFFALPSAIRAENRHISIFLNGKQTVDYIEKDETIPQSGLIGLQIHGGFTTQVSYKDIILEKLP